MSNSNDRANVAPVCITFEPAKGPLDTFVTELILRMIRALTSAFAQARSGPYRLYIREAEVIGCAVSSDAISDTESANQCRFVVNAPGGMGR